MIRLAGFSYRVPIILAGEPVEAVVADHLVRVLHRDVLVAEHVQRRKPDNEPRAGDQWVDGDPSRGLRAGRSRSPPPTGSGTPGGAAVCRSRSSPARCSWSATGRSSRSTRSATTGPKNMARSPPRTGGPATTRMRRPGRRQGHAAARSACRPSPDPDPSDRRHQ